MHPRYCRADTHRRPNNTEQAFGFVSFRLVLFNSVGSTPAGLESITHVVFGEYHGVQLVSAFWRGRMLIGLWPARGYPDTVQHTGSVSSVLLTWLSTAFLVCADCFERGAWRLLVLAALCFARGWSWEHGTASVLACRKGAFVGLLFCQPEWKGLGNLVHYWSKVCGFAERKTE